MAVEIRRATTNVAIVRDMKKAFRTLYQRDPVITLSAKWIRPKVGDEEAWLSSGVPVLRLSNKYVLLDLGEPEGRDWYNPAKSEGVVWTFT